MKIDVTRELTTLDGGPLPFGVVFTVPQLMDLLRQWINTTLGGLDQANLIAQSTQAINSFGVTTLRKVCTDALVSVGQREGVVQPDEKIHRYDIALQIQRNDAVELEAKDIAMIQRLVGKRYSPIVVGQAHRMLEGPYEDDGTGETRFDAVES